MNAEAQQIAIAEALGWLVTDDGSNNYKIMGSRHGWKQGFRPEPIPDYLNDLNAMHEAVKTLPQNLMPRYFACLCNVVSGSLSLYGYSKATEATAPQRCEAFLKTIDKWENDR